MKHLLSICAVLLSLFVQAQVSTINTQHFGPMRAPSAEIRREGRYGDSARMAMEHMLKAKTRDSAAYYNAQMTYYRDKESKRQFEFTDSSWRMKQFQRERGWRPYKTGSQALNVPFKLDAVAFMNTSDAYISCPGEYVPMDI